MATPRKTPTPSPSYGPENQLTRTDAARFLSLSLSSIKRFEKEGQLEGVKCEDGVTRFDMGVLEAFRAERAGLPSPEIEKIVATIDSATGQADKSAKHTERILNIVLDPSESLLEMYKEECAALRKREAELQSELLGMLTQLREILKEQRAEDIEERELERRAKRKDMALNMLRDALPMIMQQLTGREAGQLLQLVRSFSPEQVQVLTASGLLTTVQLQALSGLLSSEQRESLAPLHTSEVESPEAEA